MNVLIAFAAENLLMQETPKQNYVLKQRITAPARIIFRFSAHSPMLRALTLYTKFLKTSTAGA